MHDLDEFLFLIPARGGSKGVSGKNIKWLGDKPLIQYTIDFARSFVPDHQICVSSDDEHIIQVVEEIGLNVPFKRPPHLAEDDSSMQDVIVHALDFYENNKDAYKHVILLQPTSPFRKQVHLKNAINIYRNHYPLDMVVSVTEATSNPYYVHFTEDENGNLVKLFPESHFSSRQQVPTVYEYNGSIYVINSGSIRTHPRSHFRFIRKSEMESHYSVDIDTEMDWLFCEFLLGRHVFE